MDENSIPIVVSQSAKGATNSRDWQEMGWSLLIQIGAAAISIISTWITVSVVPYLQSHPGTATTVALAMIPVITAAISSLGEWLKKRYTGPPADVVDAVNFGGTPPKGWTYDTAVKKD